jgi:hypothetical protein
MSYQHPTAETNSGGTSPDPLTGARLQRAQANFDRFGKTGASLSDYNPFSSWKRVTQDLIHFTPIDSLPQEEQDAIRYRRRKNFQDSAVPWIVSDYTGLMTAYDDVDDLLKTKTLIQDYGLTPAARAAKKLLGKRKPSPDERLDGWRDTCDTPAPPREKKLQIPSYGGLNFLAALGLDALAVLFPSWRLAALLFQALQTTDSFFGVGMQLGPVLGFAAEAAFRGLAYVGGPIVEFQNKYEQLKAARVVGSSNQALAAAPHAHPDDALTLLTGLHYATGSDVLPLLVIDTKDYPSLANVFDLPWSPSPDESILHHVGVTIPEDILGNAATQGFNAARLAASLPYNLGAALTNSILSGTLADFSRATGGPGANGLPALAADNETRAIMKLTEEGICPANQCDAELTTDLNMLSRVAERFDPATGQPVNPINAARSLKFHINDVRQIAQTLL